ncbi:DUF6965 family protein [Pedobacter ureilyticus]|jgi:hypothetical protein|uniref:DUF6965 family protein n=1 Tax=Pedobacter ureilyticus TaxID=1393051 RepID=A0ABW9J095_9SPHI|nr:hypothetical protein [Pedobacter helvus]
MTVEELKEWYKNAPAPEMPVQLDEATKVNDFNHFVTSHFDGIDAAKVEMTKQPLINRLLKMKLLIEANL